MRGTHGWAEVSRERKREIIDAIVANTPTRGPVHAELDLTDRCNVACYFCNQQDLRTKEQIPLKKTTELIDEMAEAGLRSVRLSGGGDVNAALEILAIGVVVGDHVIGGKQAEHGRGIGMQEQKCCQADCGCGVAADGFGDDLALFELRKLADDGGP